MKLPETESSGYHAKLCAVNWLISRSNVYTRDQPPGNTFGLNKSGWSDLFNQLYTTKHFSYPTSEKHLTKYLYLLKSYNLLRRKS